VKKGKSTIANPNSTPKYYTSVITLSYTVKTVCELSYSGPWARLKWMLQKYSSELFTHDLILYRS